MISRRNAAAPSHDEIAKLAFEIYESEGRPVGREAEHWFQAEQQLAHVNEELLETKQPRRAGARRPGAHARARVAHHPAG